MKSNAKLLLVLSDTKALDLRDTLVKLGYTNLEHIASNDQALEYIRKYFPDLVLVEIHAESGVGGIEFGQKIYTQYDIPVVYISDRSSQTTIRRSRGTTPFGYLFDPIDESKILATIEVAITRHALERELQGNKQWLNGIVNGISDGLIAVDMDETIRLFNPVAEELTEEISFNCVGKNLKDVLKVYYANTDERVTFSHILTFFQNQNFRTEFEASLIRKNGSRLPIEISISPIKNEKEHTQTGIILLLRDITDRKRALEEISRHARWSESMRRAAKQLSSSLDVKTVLDMVCEISNQIVNTNATVAFILSADQKYLKYATHVLDRKTILETDPKDFLLPVPLIENFISLAEPLLFIENFEELHIPEIPFWDDIKKKNIRSVVIVGMYQKESLIGVLIAQTLDEVRTFTEAELEFLRGLTDQASIAVSNAILFEQVVAGRERQQALTRRLVSLQEDERRNLAQDLHDQIGQMLTGLQFSLSGLLPQAPHEQKEKIASIQKSVSNLISQTRELSLNLRPSMLDDTGLVLTLIWHFDRYTSQTDIQVDFQHFNILQKRFSSEIETTVFRIIQESLTNVARYAETDSVNIRLEYEEEVIKLDIIDHGKGFDLEVLNTKSHMGINGMRERAYSVGGLLDINSSLGNGTHIHAAIPLSGIIERRHHER